MKKGIHPKLYDAVVKCACGATYTVKSTKKEFRVDVCSACHPFYTGKTTTSAIKGRAEKFKEKYGTDY
jgi:large subunit ribosomal protein L31